MKLMYNCAQLPKDQKLLLEDINSAAERLFEKLTSFNINVLNISDYNKRYFGDKLAGLIVNLRLNTYLLLWSVAKSDVPVDKFVFLDYGGGSGMLSLLAKELECRIIAVNKASDGEPSNTVMVVL